MECLILNKSNCKNCYKCVRHCPVKSIRVSGGQAHILENECILCGRCFVACQQNAKQIVDETEKVRVLLQTGEPVVASLAPSFVANYPGVGIEGMREALKQLGFADVEETALGAAMVKTEYERMTEQHSQKVIISSCCHSVNLLIQMYFPDLMGYLAPVMSPMQAHCQDIRRRIPGAKTVFIGPCIAKKDEAQNYGGLVDAVLTFDELSDWLHKERITPKPTAATEQTEKGLTRIFPTAGGILRTMTERNPDYVYLAVDGIENVMAALRDIRSGSLSDCFLEMNACVGGCVGGPVMEKHHSSPVKNGIALNQYSGQRDFDVQQPDSTALVKVFRRIDRHALYPTEDEIRETLHKMGKQYPSDELNCGSCGYETCRDKAIAILQGKAEISMCMPFLKERAETLSDAISNSTPDAILVLNEDLEVQQVNPAAVRLLNLRSDKDILGDNVVNVLDPLDFIEVLTSAAQVRDKREYLAEYNRYVDKTIVYNRGYHLLLCIMRDVTEAEQDRERREDLRRATVETADRVVEKQMRIVQDIASLLGETAAETKIALTRLKESIENE